MSRRLLLLGALAGAVLSLPPSGPARAEPSTYLSSLRERAQELSRRRRSPEGMLPLLGLMSFWDRVPPEDVEQLIQLARDPRSHPLVQGYARYLASEAAVRRGLLDQASRLRAEAGFITDWLLCGPFDSQGRGGHAQAHPPEADLDEWPDASRRYPGKEQQVGWRSITGLAQVAQVPAGAYIEPARQATVYLQTLISSERDQPAALRLGTGGAFRVFLNGREVAAREVYRAPRPDQDAVGIWLSRGVNRLVIKETVDEARWDIYARLTRPDGAPLVGVTTSDRVPAGTAPLTGRPRPVSVVDLPRRLTERCSQRPDDPERLRDLALLQARLGPEDLEERAAERAAERWAERAPSQDSLLLLAAARRDRNRAREAAERAVALGPSSPRGLHRLALLRQSERRTLEAVELWKRALTRAPDFLPARYQLAQVYRGAGLEELAALTLDQLLRLHPRVGLLLRARAELAQSRNEMRLAAELYRRCLELNQADVSARLSLAGLALRRGDAKAALEEHDLAVRFQPQSVHLRLGRARVLAGMGRVNEAVAECERALSIEPRAVRALEEMGRLLLRAGRRQAAWRAWQRALSIRPQNAELRGYLAFLDPQRTRGRAERYREDTARLLTSAKGRTSPGEPATVLLDHTVVEVHPSGLSRSLRQRLVRLDSSSGERELSSFAIQYSPDRQTTEVRVAKIHLAAGGEKEATQDESSLNEPWARLWYDMRARVLRFDGLQVGDIVEVEYVVEDVAADNLFADYFGQVVTLQDRLPVQRFEYVLLTPEARKIYVREPKRLPVEHAVKQSEGWRTDRWIARDLPKVIAEPGMPGPSEVSDYLHVSTYQRWEDVARWYWGLVKEQLRATPRVTETARRVTAGAKTDWEKIRAIQRFVARSTRYIGLEFGIHGYKPYAVDQVLARKFGDCKDKASLLVALLGEVGIEAHLVVVRTRHRGALEPYPASLDAFNHAIAYVPRHRLYLDGTAEFSGSQELPSADQGVMALHIERGGGGLKDTPRPSADENRTILRSRWDVGADGGVRVEESIEVRGQAAAGWRERYQAADQRRQEFEKRWNASGAAGKLLQLTMSDTSDLENPVRVQATLQAQGLAHLEEAGRISVRLRPDDQGLTGSLARLSARRHPLVLDHPWRTVEELRLVAPAGWRVQRAPSEATFRSRFGSVTRKVRSGGGELWVTTERSIELVRILPGEYPEFRAFLRKVDELDAERVALVQ